MPLQHTPVVDKKLSPDGVWIPIPASVTTCSTTTTTTTTTCTDSQSVLKQFSHDKTENLQTAKVRVQDSRTEGNQETVVSKLLNWSPTEEESPLESMEEDEDPYPDKDFDYRVSKEPSKYYFQTWTRKLGGKRRKFDAILQDLKRFVECPELVDPEEAATSMKSLKSYYKELRRIRTEATKGFNEYTKQQDTYMDKIYCEYLDIRQNIYKSMPGVKEIIEGTQFVYCNECASSAMKPAELTEHKKLHHSDRFSPPAVPPRTTRTQPSGYHTSGSYKAKAPFLKKDLNLADTDHSSTSNKSSKGSQRSFRRSARIPYRRASHRLVGSFSRSSSNSPDSRRSHRSTLQQGQDFLQLFSKMAAMQAESHFKKEEVCGIFSPQKFHSGEIFAAYQNWRLELLDLEDAMRRFQYTKTRMYRVLKTRLEGPARSLIREVHPNDKSYERAKRKLDETYWNKSLHVRDLVHKMKNLPKMDQTSASKVADFATESLSLMNQLEEILEVDHRNEQPTFLFFSEIIVPKFNTLASQMWEKLYTREEGESFALGHSLGLKDLKKVINKTKSKLRHREYN